MKSTKTVLENYIINGRANMNYNFEQFKALTEDEQRHWLWYAVCNKEIESEDFRKPKTEQFEELFNRVKAAKYISYRNETTTLIGNKEVSTAAQAMTLIGYGDTNGINLRSLDYNVKCEDFQDFKKCLKIIDQYNEFNYSTMKEHIYDYLEVNKFYGETNPNNGLNLFNFWIGRESSPVFYVEFTDSYNPNQILNRNGAEVEFCSYTAAAFKVAMNFLRQMIKSDEFNIKEVSMFGYITYTARFWFD